MNDADTGRMKKIARKLKKIGFSVKLYVFLFLLGSAGIVCLQTIQFKNIEESQRQDALAGIRNDLNQINLFMNNFRVNCMYTLMNLVSRSDLTRLSEQERIQSLYELCRTSNLIQNIFIQDERGRITSSHQVVYQVVGNENMECLLKEAGERRSIIRYSKPYYSAMCTGNTIGAAITSDDGKLTVGVELNLSYLYDAIRQTLGNNKIQFMMVSGQDNIFMFDRGGSDNMLAMGEYPIQIAEEYRALLGKEYEDNELLHVDIPNRSFMMFTDQNEWGWKLYIFIDEELLAGNLTEIYAGFIRSAVIWILILAALVFVVSGTFTRRLRFLAKTMEGIEHAEDLVEIPIVKEDEIGRLSHSYNLLLGRIRQLLEEARESERKKTMYEIRMLQSQIGPHFLYNTLLCIRSLLRQNRAADAKEALQALLGLLAYSFDKKEEFVTIEEEMKELEAYVCIARMRFGDFFVWKNEIEECVLQSKIPRLSLQPIVENAIFHGLRPKEEEGRMLWIGISREKTDVIIRICDNGVGMTEETCARILTGNTEKVGERLSSIGISNVHERLRLIYGPEYGITVRSELGKGTEMRLRIRDSR